MINARHFLTLLLPLFLFTCGPATEPVTEGAGVDTEADSDIENPNADNTDIYDVDPEDPYLISNGTFLGLKPGEPLAEYAPTLRSGVVQTGDGDYTVYFIDGAEGDELGYVMRGDYAYDDKIGDIYVTHPSVVTEQGIRVGTTVKELRERIGAVTFHGSEIESRVTGSKDGIGYRLDIPSTEYNMDNSKIPADAMVQMLIIERPIPAQ